MERVRTNMMNSGELGGASTRGIDAGRIALTAGDPKRACRASHYSRDVCKLVLLQSNAPRIARTAGMVDAVPREDLGKSIESRVTR